MPIRATDKPYNRLQAQTRPMVALGPARPLQSHRGADSGRLGQVGTGGGGQGLARDWNHTPDNPQESQYDPYFWDKYYDMVSMWMSPLDAAVLKYRLFKGLYTPLESRQ